MQPLRVSHSLIARGVLPFFTLPEIKCSARIHCQHAILYFSDTLTFLSLFSSGRGICTAIRTVLGWTTISTSICSSGTSRGYEKRLSYHASSRR